MIVESEKLEEELKKVLPAGEMTTSTKQNTPCRVESNSAGSVARNSNGIEPALSDPDSETSETQLPGTGAETLCVVEPARVGPGIRLFEIAVASFGLVLTFPVMLVIGLIIKSSSKGPMLFRQKRLGAGGKPFTFIKFRTMYVDARERFPELYEYKYSTKELDQLRFKVENDPRTTPQGEWLRKTSLDELPNFWNVLTGDMSLVGPRPEIPEMLPYYKGEMLQKFSVRPGVTGLAQVSGRGRLGFYETVDLDLECVRNKSFIYDLKIICMTIKQVVMGDGAF